MTYWADTRDDWPFSLECTHVTKLEELWDQLEALGIDYPDKDPRYVSLENSPQNFDDTTAEVTSWTTGWGAECEWVCPSCGGRNTEELTKEDFYG